MAARTWAIRIGCGALLLGLAGGGYVAANWGALSAAAAARALAAARNDADRDAAAQKLIAAGPDGRDASLAVFRGESEPECHALAAAAAAAGTLPAFYPQIDSFSPTGLAAILLHLPADTDPAARGVILAGLKCDHEAATLNAIRAALRPGADAAGELPPLLASRYASVRAAALLAAGTASGVNDEDLFRLLHDPDALVRTRCVGALKARGRSSDEIACGKKLVSPDPADRLKLLTDLRFADDTLKDISPWLERLAADADPAVRAGAARVAVECRLPFAAWVAKLANSDPDPAVRRVAGYYRLKAADADLAPAEFRK